MGVKVGCGEWRSTGVALVAMHLIGCVAAAAADGTPFQPHIVNGTLTSQYPTIGVLLDSSNPNSASMICSGTLVGCHTFVTAGHCVEGDLNPTHYSVFLQHAGFFTLSSIVLHPAYNFPVGDVAVLKLAAAVTGITPTQLNGTAAPAPNTVGTIVGFGRSGGATNDYGLKRVGAVTTETCSDGISNSSSVCWKFTNPLGPPSTNSSTCNGDSGGPLLIDSGGGETLAGVTSGGRTASCLPYDQSFDANVAAYASFIAGVAGGDLANTSCGALPPVGDARTRVRAVSGSLESDAPDGTSTFTVPAGTSRLRVAMNAVDDSSSDFDLYVKAGSPPSLGSADCAAEGGNQYGFCEFTAPATGPWHVLVHRFAGAGAFQVTITLFGTDCALPGNQGAACDDQNACTGNDTCQSGICTGTLIADDTPCDDGNECTVGDSCQNGSCRGAGVADGTPCNDGNPCSRPDTCQSGVCTGNSPALDCKQRFTPGRGVFALNERSSDGRGSVSWMWMSGSATAKAEFGDPTSTSDYDLCVYDERAGVTTQIMHQHIPSGSNWKSFGRGFRYHDRKLRNSGISALTLTAGGDGRAHIGLRGRSHRVNRLLLPLALQNAVTVQLLDENTCWEGRYSNAITNQSSGFRARSD